MSQVLINQVQGKCMQSRTINQLAGGVSIRYSPKSSCLKFKHLQISQEETQQEKEMRLRVHNLLKILQAALNTKMNHQLQIKKTQNNISKRLTSSMKMMLRVKTKLVRTMRNATKTKPKTTVPIESSIIRILIKVIEINHKS